jgi:pimeloyl-ACP methyl ester carboxylesterase
MAEVLANGVRFHVQRLRPARRAPGALPQPLDGLIVVFLHGLVMDNLSSFYYTLGGAAAQAGAEAILYDLRGHGLSDRPPSGYTLEDSIADLGGILGALGVDVPVHLVGNSYGGMIALGTAIAHPERVAGLVLIEAHYAADGWRQQMGSFLRMVSRGLHDRELLQRLTELWGRKFTRVARAADALIHGTSFAGDLLAAEPFSQETLRAITCPALALYGERSDLVERGRGLAAALPGCTLEILPGQTHSVLTEDTARLRDIVLRWLAGAGHAHARAPGPGPAVPRARALAAPGAIGLR